MHFVQHRCSSVQGCVWLQLQGCNDSTCRLATSQWQEIQNVVAHTGHGVMQATTTQCHFWKVVLWTPQRVTYGHCSNTSCTPATEPPCPSLACQ